MLLLVLGGVGLFLVLKDDEPTTVATTQTIEQTTETSETEESSEETTEESTESTEENENDLINEGSPDAGAAFLDLVAAGDYPTAFGMLAEHDDLVFDLETIADHPASCWPSSKKAAS